MSFLVSLDMEPLGSVLAGASKGAQGVRDVIAKAWKDHGSGVAWNPTTAEAVAKAVEAVEPKATAKALAEYLSDQACKERRNGRGMAAMMRKLG